MVNYPQELPRDKGMAPMTGLVPAFPAKKTYLAENASASSVITLTPDTTSIEIAAKGATAFMKWITTADTNASVVASVSGANWDHVIPDGQYRRLVVPIEKNNPYPSIQGVGPANGLYARVAYKTQAIGSIFATEY